MTEPTSLYVPADEAGMAALGQEWLAARIVFVAGFVIAIAFVTWWSYSHRPVTAADLGGVYADDSAAGDQPVNVQTTKEGFALCRMTIAVAENFGVLPTTMKFAGGPNKTDTQGRYVCLATDNGGKQYTLASDLVCRDLNNPNCVSLVDVKSGDTSIYHRADPPAASDAAPAPDATTSPADTTGSTDTSSVDATGAATPPADGSQPPPQ
jgi:hypothetical protein